MKPIMFENSRVPKFLSVFAPIDIWAISFGPFVWCKGELSERVRRHETIHYRQQLELLFVGQWLLYLVFYLIGLITHRSGRQAYRLNPFEVEAYTFDETTDYLHNRRLYRWTDYLASLKPRRPDDDSTL